MVTLTRSATVMELACATEGCDCRTVGADGLVKLLQVDDDTQVVRQSLGLTPEKFEDLGRPEAITVTVEPGGRS